MTEKRPASESGASLAVLVVDSDAAARSRTSRLLKRQFGERVTIREAGEGGEALRILKTNRFDVTLIDERLSDMGGLEMLDEVAKKTDDTAAILLTGAGSQQLAAEAFKHGAKDYVAKADLDGPLLEHSVNQALSSQNLARQNTRLAQQLQRTQAHLDHFLRAISHDMGANFMMLKSSYGQLKRAVGDSALPAALEASTHVEACLRESQRFLEDLAQLSTTGSVSMEAGRVELGPLVKDLLFELKSLFEERGIQAIAAGPLPALRCHEGRVRQVFSNLIRNAARHGCDPIDPRLTISTALPPAGREQQGYAWFAVHDNGSGIPERFRDEIFLPGKRVPGTETAGSGMGLAIVKRIIDHYGGTILIDPAAIGARFVFSLPSSG